MASLVAKIRFLHCSGSYVLLKRKTKSNFSFFLISFSLCMTVPTPEIFKHVGLSVGIIIEVMFLRKIRALGLYLKELIL